jgi:ABC-2 type transport system permease protein
MMAREVGRTGLAAFISVVSVLIVSIFFYSKIVIAHSFTQILIIIPTMLLAVVSELLVSYLVGCIAFWTVEVAGVYASLERLKAFFAGGYFPLSLLPSSLATLSYFLPFAYSFYVPTLYFIGKIDASYIVRGWGVQVAWIIGLYFIIKLVWSRGLKRYEGTGM